MRRTAQLFLSFALCLFALAVSAQTEKYTREYMQQMYMDFLDEKGFQGHFVDDDGDVQFKYETKTYYFDVEEDDLQFFRIVLPNIWELESEAEVLAALIACNDATNRTKVAKAYIGGNDYVSISAEILIAEPENFREVFQRCLSVIAVNKGHFQTKIREIIAEAEGE